MADQRADKETAPQERREIIFCETCDGISVATAWISKHADALLQLNNGKHKNHKFIATPAEVFYARGESNPQTLASLSTYNKLTAEAGGILIY